eukprot:6200514-Amphidinium_carterae.1
MFLLLSRISERSGFRDQRSAFLSLIPITGVSVQVLAWSFIGGVEGTTKPHCPRCLSWFQNCGARRMLPSIDYLPKIAEVTLIASR